MKDKNYLDGHDVRNVIGKTPSFIKVNYRGFLYVHMCEDALYISKYIVYKFYYIYYIYYVYVQGIDKVICEYQRNTTQPLLIA